MIKILVVGALLISGISCRKKVEERPAKLGVEVSVQDVQNAIDEALKDSSLAFAKVGDTVEYEVNARAELGSVSRIYNFQQSLNRIAVDETAQTVTFTFGEKKAEFDFTTGGLVDYKESEFDQVFKLSGASINSSSRTSSQPSENLFSLKQLVAQNVFQPSSAACDGVDQTDGFGFTYDCIKYFNLSLTQTLQTPPDKVVAKPNCMNLPNCQIRVNTLKFDEVKWRAGQSVDTTTITAEISPDVPDIMFFTAGGGINYRWPGPSYCDKGLINNIIVTQCFVLRDFYLAP